jgi:hypothetical protein
MWAAARGWWQLVVECGSSVLAMGEWLESVMKALEGILEEQDMWYGHVRTDKQLFVDGSFVASCRAGFGTCQDVVSRLKDSRL